MQGFTDDGKVGHAWVACGYHDIDHYTEYELLTMPEEFHPGGTFVFLFQILIQLILISVLILYELGMGR